MNMTAVINQLAVLFILLAVGYTANKFFKIMSPESDKILTKILLNITMPCLILSSVMGEPITATGSQAAFFMLMVLVLYALFFIISLPVPWLTRFHQTDSGMSRFSIMFGNVGFMGFPVISVIFGTSAVFYVALVNMVFTVLHFSIGLTMVSGKAEKINFRLFINPSLVASLVAILLFALGIKSPVVIASTVGILGQITIPCAMLIIGSSLAMIPLKEVFSEIRIYPLTVIKLVLVPLLSWLVFHLFITDKTMLGVLVVLSGMPTAITATMLSLEYGGNDKLASKIIFITTLASIVTIPLMVFLLN